MGSGWQASKRKAYLLTASGATLADKATLHIGAVVLSTASVPALTGRHERFHVCALDSAFEEVPVDHWTSRMQLFLSVGLAAQA